MPRTLARLFTLPLLLALNSCIDSPDPSPSALSGGTEKFTPFVSAHRGGAAYAPENTMSAYRNAARMEVDDFETDTTPTKDGVLVLIHDDTVDRTTNCSGPVNSFTFAELQHCDAGYWWTPGQSTTTPDTEKPHPFRGKGLTIPTVQELFAFAKSLPYGPTVTIEIKNIPYETQYEPLCLGAAQKLVELIQNSGIKERIVVQAFDPTCIDQVKRLDGSVQTLYLSLFGANSTVAYCAAMGHEYAAPPFDTQDFNAQAISNAHALGIKVNPYTVDREADIQKVIGLGVDALITNYPACMMKLQGRAVPSRLIGAEAGADIPIPLCRGG